ncbi:hypothetical protein [Streptomyces sp. NPDC058295]|uniref:hypothetical protein n=1 Tax=Streptomyces sp. NPDC058295 TaxID=3346431 RepID=UPI0036E89F32
MHLSALRAGMPFVILQLVPLLLAPVLSRMLTRVEPRRLLMGGLLPMAAGQFWIAALPITTTSLAAFIGPVLLLGIGFICVVSSLTSAAVNAGSDSARAAAEAALGHGMAAGVVICGRASLLGALVTLFLVRRSTAQATVGAQVQTATVQAPALGRTSGPGGGAGPTAHPGEAGRRSRPLPGSPTDVPRG